ncbi:MAG: molybdopterin-guanine dinucleotide biosynthesis protein B [Pseudomonadota bacterium]
MFGLAGWSGSGKTTLVRSLVPTLIRAGITVSTVKHAHHNFDIDQPGKDSHTHREAGAQEVLVSSAKRWALIHEHRGAPEPTLDDLLRLIAPVDLVLVEGFKKNPHPKLEVWREATGKPPLWPDDPTILAVASDGPITGLDRPLLALDDVPEIARFILTAVGLEDALVAKEAAWPS